MYKNGLKFLKYYHFSKNKMKLILIAFLGLVNIVYGQKCPKLDDGVIGKGDWTNSWAGLWPYDGGVCSGGCGYIYFYFITLSGQIF